MPKIARRLLTLPYYDLLAALEVDNVPPGGLALFDECLDEVAPRQVNSVLDIGCNTGLVTRVAATRFGAIAIGLDLSPEMCRAARRKARRLRLPRRQISFVPGNAAAMPFANERFDLVVCGGSFAFMSSQRRVARECYRVLRPSGRLLFIEFLCRRDIPRPLLSRVRAITGARFVRQSIPDVKRLFSRAGFDRLRVRRVTNRVADGMSKLAGDDRIDLGNYLWIRRASQSGDRIALALESRFGEISRAFADARPYLEAVVITAERPN